jgi:hypothetical protein
MAEDSQFILKKNFVDEKKWFNVVVFSPSWYAYAFFDFNLIRLDHAIPINIWSMALIRISEVLFHTSL